MIVALIQSDDGSSRVKQLFFRTIPGLISFECQSGQQERGFYTDDYIVAYAGF